MTACDPLELEILPPYIGSAVSPTVDITETTDDITVTITDFRGEHAYTVDKTDQAIADAEQAATNANTAAANATSTANQAAQAATQAAGTANTAASNADTKAALADSKAALAQSAATTANQAAEAAEAAKTAANTAAGQATTAATNATTAAGTANTAASNADAKAQLADTAATNANTATAAANTATTNATNAAQAANNAAGVAIEAAEDMPRLVGTVDSMQAVNDAWPTTMESATVYGESVQDGTPTPDNPVPVQVVGGCNQLDTTQYYQSGSYTHRGVTYTINADGTVTANGTATGGNSFCTIYHYLTSHLELNKTYTYTSNADGVNVGYYTGTISAPYSPSITFTFDESWTNWNLIIEVSNGTTVDNVIVKPQLQYGTKATPYTPYGCIGLQNGNGITPIDLQGHVLASLPDGTQDALRIDSAGVKGIEQYVGVVDLGALTWYYASGASSRMYANIADIVPGGSPSVVSNMLCSGFKPATYNAVAGHAEPNIMCVHISAQVIWVYAPDMGTDPAAFKTAVSGVMLYYQLAESQTIELGTITPPSIAPGDTLAIYASLDPDWQIEYTQDPNLVVHSLQASIAPVEGATASTNYAVGAYLMHGNQLYRVTSAIATGETITPGSNCVACTVMGEIVRLTA